MNLKIEDFNQISVNEKEALISLVFDREKHKETNGELFMQFVGEVITEWEDNKDAYGGERSDFMHEFCDGRVDIYTSELFKWYSDNPDMCYYADEGITEFAPVRIIQTLQFGQYLFLKEMVNTILDRAKVK